MGEEEHGSQQSVRCEQPTAVSRRRITFKPYSILQPVGALCSQPSTSAANVNIDQNSSIPTPGTSLGKTTRKWGIWSNLEIGAFYDGIKQFGKDFDQVAKLMAKKKMKKDKDQIRNYYYNSFKLLRTTARFEDDVITGFPKDAMELFILINGFEWKKRTEDMKIDPVKLRQLVLEGSTSVKKKNRILVVRTPFCPSLQKFFPSQRSVERLPSQVVLWLTPKTQADRRYVESCCQNPLLRVRVSVGDRIARIFLLLKAKWIPQINKQEIFEQEDFCSSAGKVNLVLYPDKSTKLESVVLKHVKDLSSSLLSLNRLKKELNWSFHEKCDEVFNGEVALSPKAVLNASESFAENSTEISTTSSGDGDSFSLSASRLRFGLSEEIAGNATIMELFYLCGMETNIRLQYTTNFLRKSTVEPWNIFISLINRNYGENLCKILSEPEEAENAQNCTIAAEVTRKRRISSSLHGEAVKHSADTERQLVPATAAPNLENVSTVHDQVVESENNAFKIQFESMQQSRKRGRALVQRDLPPKCNTGAVSSQPIQLGTFTTSLKPASATVSRPNCYYVSPEDFAQARQSVNGQFIDFSSIVSTGMHSVHLRDTSDQLGNDASNTTSKTNFAAEVLTSMNLQNRDDTANGCSLLHFEPVIPLHDSAHGVSYSKMCDSDLTQKTLTELSAVDFCGSSSNVDLTPVKNSSNLPEDVRHSFEMMMQQNSVDYCRNFEQLITSIETPKKIA